MIKTASDKKEKVSYINIFLKCVKYFVIFFVSSFVVMLFFQYLILVGIIGERELFTERKYIRLGMAWGFLITYSIYYWKEKRKK